jgi:hypothetical protein
MFVWVNVIYASCLLSSEKMARNLRFNPLHVNTLNRVFDCPPSQLGVIE